MTHPAAELKQRQIQWYEMYSAADRENKALNKALLAVRQKLATVEAERDHLRGELGLATIKLNKVKELVK
jgi:hypothetical protein